MAVRAAIVGLGRWGKSLVNSVHGKAGEIQFVAAHSRTRASAEDFLREKSIPFVDNYEAILADKTIDAVVLATPHSQHAEQVIAATKAGKHIHCEKPLTRPRERQGRGRGREKSRAHTRGRLQPPLPSFGRGSP